MHHAFLVWLINKPRQWKKDRQGQQLMKLRENCKEWLTRAVANKADIVSAQREPEVTFILDKWLQQLSGSTGYIIWPNQADISAEWIN